MEENERKLPPVTEYDIEVVHAMLVGKLFREGKEIADGLDKHAARALLVPLGVGVRKSEEEWSTLKRLVAYNDSGQRKSGPLHELVSSDALLEVLKGDPDKCELLHALLGVLSEAHELADAFVDHLFRAKDDPDGGYDPAHVVNELGDLEFFLRAVRHYVDVSRAETLAANIVKLSARFPSGVFSVGDAAARKDEAAQTGHVSPGH